MPHGIGVDKGGMSRRMRNGVTKGEPIAASLAALAGEAIML